MRAGQPDIGVTRARVTWIYDLRARSRPHWVAGAWREPLEGVVQTTKPPDDLIMSVERADDGRWQVEAEGSVVEDGFMSRGSAARWIADRSDLDDRDLRSMVSRASPAQRRELRAMLDDLDGDGGYGPT